MNNDILIEKIEYLSSLPHSALVKHCIYLENENDNYKAQKYITDFISENGIICEKNKEIQRLNNIINELEKMFDGDLDGFQTINEKGACNDIIEVIQNYKDKLKKLKEGKNDE